MTKINKKLLFYSYLVASYYFIPIIVIGGTLVSAFITGPDFSSYDFNENIKSFNANFWWGVKFDYGYLIQYCSPISLPTICFFSLIIGAFYHPMAGLAFLLLPSLFLLTSIIYISFNKLPSLQKGIRKFVFISICINLFFTTLVLARAYFIQQHFDLSWKYYGYEGGGEINHQLEDRYDSCIVLWPDKDGLLYTAGVRGGDIPKKYHRSYDFHKMLSEKMRKHESVNFEVYSAHSSEYHMCRESCGEQTVLNEDGTEVIDCSKFNYPQYKQLPLLEREIKKIVIPYNKT